MLESYLAEALSIEPEAILEAEALVGPILTVIGGLFAVWNGTKALWWALSKAKAAARSLRGTGGELVREILKRLSEPENCIKTGDYSLEVGGLVVALPPPEEPQGVKQGPKIRFGGQDVVPHLSPREVRRVVRRTQSVLDLYTAREVSARAARDAQDRELLVFLMREKAQPQGRQPPPDAVQQATNKPQGGYKQLREGNSSRAAYIGPGLCQPPI